MNYTFNKEQTRIVMNVDALACIKKDTNIFNIAKDELMKGTNKNLTMEQAFQVVSELSNRQEALAMKLERKGN